MQTYIITGSIAIIVILLVVILNKLLFIIKNQKTMQTDVAALQANVAQETNLEQSIITLLTGLSNQIQSGIDAQDLAAIQAVNTQLGTNIANLTAAITANTPAASASPATPAVS